MKPITKALVVGFAFATPQLCAADTWSNCQTITAVVNYTAHSNQILLALSPGITGCNTGADAQGAVFFTVGQEDVSPDSLKGFLATALSAYLTGKRVQIFYNENTPTCYSSTIAVGGYAAQCN